MAIQAMFRCIASSGAVSDPNETYGTVARFTPVYSDDPDSPNHAWSKYTPAGYLEMYVTNPDVKFGVNKEYLLTFEEQ